MATATIEKSKELRQKNTNGLAVEFPREIAIAYPLMAYPLPFGPDEPVDAVHEPKDLPAATATNVSVPLHRDDFLTSLVGRVAAFHDWLLGPPQSERDRVNARLIRARDYLHWSG